MSRIPCRTYYCPICREYYAHLGVVIDKDKAFRKICFKHTYKEIREWKANPAPKEE